MHPDQPAPQAREQADVDSDAGIAAGDDVDGYLSEDLPTDFSEQAAGTAVSDDDPGTQASADGAAVPATPASTPAPAPVSGPGSVLRERFVLQTRLGGGNMGQVYKALDRRRQESGDTAPWVAIKLVQPAPGQHPQAREALHQEAQLAQRLTHPNIVRIFDVDRDGDSSFLVMEWLDGESLASFLDGRRWRPLPRLQALQIVEGICRALSYAHGRGIVHADVKPGNIFLAADGVARLLDFGVAQLSDERTGEQLPALVRGHTPEYASPEVIEGAAPAAADDLFSLACVAYRMLAGKRAFGKLNALEAEAAGLRPARIEHLPPAQWQALEHALAFRRADRPADVNAFIAALKGPREDSAALRDEAPAADTYDPEATLEASAEALALEVERDERAGRSARLRWVAAAAMLVAVGALVLANRPADPPTATARAPGATATAPSVPAWPDQAAAPLAGPADDLAFPADDPAFLADDPAFPADDPDPGLGDEDPAPPAIEATAAVAAEEPAGIVAETTTVISAGSAADTGTPAMTQAAGPLPPQAGPPLPRQPAPDESPPRATPGAAPPVPTPAAPVSRARDALPQVAMAELRFRRYVEPRFFRTGLPAVSGWVDVGFTVEPDGHTSGVTVLGGEPGGYWADAAAQAVRGWRFQPVARDGEVTAVRSEVRLRFAPDQPDSRSQAAAN